ncbi:hypothetical protein DEU56DRAFT_981376 [Suillus clintonianus]|uniref:uncharacterized protein n=1 Tax=Suillus clintonianus TaxID=1904413 RepID=UPI001B8821FD|nr:uncharacterized protein DEU56DRAFT_981376 [Suillus clintonianus]KAG2134495.1 hypothetical protein DEU56DRAFT_981376 [Suillus clintonianus]
MVSSPVDAANMLRVPVVQPKSSSHSHSEPSFPTDFLQSSSSGGLTKPYRQPSALRGTPLMNARALSESAVPTKSRPEKRSRPSNPLPFADTNQTPHARPLRTPTPPPQKVCLPASLILPQGSNPLTHPAPANNCYSPPTLPKSIHTLNAHPPAIFSGNFDRTFPSSSKPTSRQAAHPPTTPQSTTQSSLTSPSTTTPRPFDVLLCNLKHRAELTFTSSERASFLAPDHSPMSLGIIGQADIPQCGVNNAKGIWKMKRVWVGEGEGEEGKS